MKLSPGWWNGRHSGFKTRGLGMGVRVPLPVLEILWIVI